MSTKTVCLLTHTRNLLKNRPRCLTLPMIAEATDLSVGWLNAFSAGSYAEPSVVRVQKLFEFLSGEQLIKIEG